MWEEGVASWPSRLAAFLASRTAPEEGGLQGENIGEWATQREEADVFGCGSSDSK
jgi:hypothetical protein